MIASVFAIAILFGSNCFPADDAAEYCQNNYDFQIDSKGKLQLQFDSGKHDVLELVLAENPTRNSVCNVTAFRATTKNQKPILAILFECGHSSKFSYYWAMVELKHGAIPETLGKSNFASGPIIVNTDKLQMADFCSTEQGVTIDLVEPKSDRLGDRILHWQFSLSSSLESRGALRRFYSE